MVPPKKEVTFTEISTLPVRVRTRSVSKKVKRFLLVGGWWGRSWRGRRSRSWRRPRRAGREATSLQQPSSFWSNLCFQPRNWAGVCRFSDSCDSSVCFDQSSQLWFLDSLVPLTRLLSYALWSTMDDLAPTSLWLVILLSREHLFQWRRVV